MVVLKNSAKTNMIRMLTIHACPLERPGFRFIKKFSGRSFLSGRVVGIQSNDKRKCKFREKCFVVTRLSRNMTTTWVGRKQIIVAKAED